MKWRFRSFGGNFEVSTGVLLLFVGPQQQHMEVPRLGVESHLQMPAYSNMSVTYTIAHGHAGSLTHWTRPGIETASSWILVGFVTTEPQQDPTAPAVFIIVPVTRNEIPPNHQPPYPPCSYSSPSRPWDLLSSRLRDGFPLTYHVFQQDWIGGYFWGDF